MGKKKKVLYLVGAGATHSEVSLFDNSINMLTNSIADGIRYKIIQKKLSGLSKVVNDLTSEKTDIEQLITLYESSGFSSSQKIAKHLRDAFMTEIQERLSRLPNNYKPVLFSALIDMYDIKNFDEELQGFLTLNYDTFIETAFQNVQSSMNLFLLVDNKNPAFKIESNKTPILKLHGSFNWKNEFPIMIVEKNSRKDDILWIPPGVIKRKGQYPFDLLWGKAKELLHCDILRVIGCSLNRNDWELVSLLQTSQRFHNKRKKLIIELIDYNNEGQKKKEEYPYLNIITILELEGFKKYLFDDISLSLNSEGNISMSTEEYINNKNNINIFERWLRWRGFKLKNAGKDIKTSKSIFKNFIEYKYENIS